MSVVLGAANAYLGLRAGMTIAATYPAAVIGMAVLRMMKGSLLEENFARTVGSIGESVAAGAIFTIPAFVILQMWSFKSFNAVRVPHRERAHDRGRHPRHPVRHDPAPRDGRGPLAAVPRVGGRVRDPQGRPARRRRGDAALQRDGRRRARQAARRRRRLPAPRTRSRWRSASSRRASSGSASRATPRTIAAGGVTTLPGPGGQPRPTSASATSSAPSSAR